MTKAITPTEELMFVLDRAVSVKRGIGSVEEGAFVAWLCKRLPATMIDGAGNVHVDMRVFDKRGRTKHRTLFVSHTDTVTWGAPGPNQVKKDGPIWRGAGCTLGADDGAGVAVLSALIRSGKAAYYIFTRGEEAGGIGARYLANEMSDLLFEFDRAIAFDRKDVFSVITHQGWNGRCCSNVFAEALCTSMNDLGMMMMPDDGGVYTDTAEFVEIIPECTNISAGYNREHSKDESLDTEYLQLLTATAIALDWDALPTERDPEAREEPEWESAYPAATPTVGYKAAGKQLGAVQSIFNKAKKHPTKHDVRVSAADEEARRAERQAQLDQALDRWSRDDQDAADAYSKSARLLQADRGQDARNSMSDADPAFAWSDDGQNFYTGSGRKDN